MFGASPASCIQSHCVVYAVVLLCHAMSQTIVFSLPLCVHARAAFCVATRWAEHRPLQIAPVPTSAVAGPPHHRPHPLPLHHPTPDHVSSCCVTDAYIDCPTARLLQVTSACVRARSPYALHMHEHARHAC